MPFPIHPHMLRHGCGSALANAGHTRGRYRLGLGTRTSSTRCVTPNLRRIDLRTSGDNRRSRANFSEQKLLMRPRESPPSRGGKLATVAQPCGYPVDGQMDCLHHALVAIASTVTLQQFDLYVVEWIEVRKAVLDRARQQGVLIEQCLLAGDGEQHFNRRLPFGTQPRKDSFAQLGVLDELRVA